MCIKSQHLREGQRGIRRFNGNFDVKFWLMNVDVWLPPRHLSADPALLALMPRACSPLAVHTAILLLKILTAQVTALSLYSRPS